MVWSVALKQQFNSQQEVNMALSLSVLVINNDIESTMSKFLPAMNITVNDKMRGNGQEIDGDQIRNSDYSSGKVVKKRRKRLRREKKMVLFTKKV